VVPVWASSQARVVVWRSVPNALESVFRGAPSGFGLTLYINAYNAIFWFVLVCFIYGVVSCVLGVTARLPLVSDAAEQQIY